MRKYFLIVASIFLFFGFNFALAQENIEFHFFYNDLCSSCAEEREFLQELKAEYPSLTVNEYEFVSSPENQKTLEQFYEQRQVPKRDWGRPILFTPSQYFVGFNQQIGEKIEHCLKECLGETGQISEQINIPFIGLVDISKMSLPVLTIAFGAVDGLNPCAMWVLLFLIALLINTRSRKRMWLIVGTFLGVSAIVYFLILSAWLNLFLAISYVNLTRILIGALAIGVGLWQLKNFIKYNPGVCKVVGLKPKLQERLQTRAEKLVKSPLTWSLLVGVALLAFSVNLIEFFCSAGLPAIYTRILALSGLNALSYNLYLLLYTFVFILDDLIIFALAVITLNKIGSIGKYNYWATLIGGLLILILGILLIFQPHLLMFG